MNADAASDEKSRHILNTVRKILAEKGYAATTISLIAKEADISRGLIHYYFHNKEEILAKVLEANMTASVALVTAVLAQSGSAREMASGLIRVLRQVLEEDPTFFHLYFEGWAVARQSKLVDRMLKSLYGRFRIALEAALAQSRRKGIVTSTLPDRGLAAILTGILDGMGLQLVTEQALTADPDIWNAMETAVFRLLSGSEEGI